MAKTPNYNIECPDLTSAADITQISSAFVSLDNIIKDISDKKADTTEVKALITEVKSDILSDYNSKHGAYNSDLGNITTPGVYYGNFGAGASNDCRDVLIVAKIRGEDNSICTQILISESLERFHVSIRKGIYINSMLHWGQWTNIVDEYNLQIESDERETADNNLMSTMLGMLTIQGKNITADNASNIETGKYTNTTDNIGILYLPYAECIGSQACNDNNAITNVIAPQLKTIDNAAFWGCHKLESIFIPHCCASISNNAFSYCESLSSIIIDNSRANLAGPFYTTGCEANIIYLR